MADLKYNISELFGEAFGITRSVFFPNSEAQKNPGFDFSGLEQLGEDFKPDGTSWMGTPILFTATFKAGEYQRYKANGELEKTRLEKMQLPPATLFSFRRAKNITRTNLLGSNGTVKEIYGFDDWMIDVKGLCLDEKNKPASEQMDAILEWEKIADAIGVSGKLFNQLDINAVCISDFSKDSVQGKPGVLPFSFKLIADEAVELIL